MCVASPLLYLPGALLPENKESRKSGRGAKSAQLLPNGASPREITRARAAPNGSLIGRRSSKVGASPPFLPYFSTTTSSWLQPGLFTAR